jgi:hypothetical protein
MLLQDSDFLTARAKMTALFVSLLGNDLLCAGANLHAILRGQSRPEYGDDAMSVA